MTNQQRIELINHIHEDGALVLGTVLKSIKLRELLFIEGDLIVAQDGQIYLASRRIMKDKQAWNLFEFLGEQKMYQFHREGLLEIDTQAFAVFIGADI